MSSGNSESSKGTRLNKYIAHCGICSRRKAVEFIEKGEVKVNGEVEVLPYRLVLPEDKVTFRDELVSPIQEKLYILLNKPKDVICTLKDEHGRKTLADILEKYASYRLHYVGRLDRMTTGLILMTNDGQLTQRLAHPSSEVKKIYSVTLNKKFTERDMNSLRNGLELEDGFIRPDAVNYDKTRSGETIGVELHSGRNRIIRRMMEHLGYDVVALDRVYFAGLTKKDLPRGWHRHLTEQEIIMLKHFTGKKS